MLRLVVVLISCGFSYAANALKQPRSCPRHAPFLLEPEPVCNRLSPSAAAYTQGHAWSSAELLTHVPPVRHTVDVPAAASSTFTFSVISDAISRPGRNRNANFSASKLHHYVLILSSQRTETPYSGFQRPHAALSTLAPETTTTRTKVSASPFCDSATARPSGKPSNHDAAGVQLHDEASSSKSSTSLAPVDGRWRLPSPHVVRPRTSALPSSTRPGDNHTSEPTDIRVVTPEKLVAEVKSIYSDLVMVERKCIKIDTKQDHRVQAIKDFKWRAPQPMYGPPLPEHLSYNDSIHSAQSRWTTRLPLNDRLPGGFLKHGIHALVKLSRHRPDSRAYVLAFVGLACGMMVSLPDIGDEHDMIVNECLHIIRKYRTSIENDDTHDRLEWSEVARNWYFNSAGQSRKSREMLYAHLAVLARPKALPPLSVYAPRSSGPSDSSTTPTSTEDTFIEPGVLKFSGSDRLLGLKRSWDCSFGDASSIYNGSLYKRPRMEGDVLNMADSENASSIIRHADLLRTAVVEDHLFDGEPPDWGVIAWKDRWPLNSTMETLRHRVGEVQERLLRLETEQMELLETMVVMDNEIADLQHWADAFLDRKSTATETAELFDFTDFVDIPETPPGTTDAELIGRPRASYDEASPLTTDIAFNPAPYEFPSMLMDTSEYSKSNDLLISGFQPSDIGLFSPQDWWCFPNEESLPLFQGL
jgi:hypothetical protein